MEQMMTTIYLEVIALPMIWAFINFLSLPMPLTIKYRLSVYYILLKEGQMIFWAWALLTFVFFGLSLMYPNPDWALLLTLGGVMCLIASVLEYERTNQDDD